MTERTLRKTVTHEVIERSGLQETSFTTATKFRRHKRKYGISGKRCRDFMEWLWRNEWRDECMYEGLKIQFIKFFETNDLRTIEKYIGRPNMTIEYGREHIARCRVTSIGTSLARFQYAHRRKLNPKTGLMEYLGYMTLNKESCSVVLHHELFPYFTAQTCLPPTPPLRESDESPFQIETNAEASKQDLCVCRVETERSTRQHVDGSMGKVEREERRRRNTEHTHKSGLLEIQLDENSEKTDREYTDPNLEYLDLLAKAVPILEEPARRVRKPLGKGRNS